MFPCRAVVGSPYSLDHMLGLQYFTTDTLGIGGRLRCYCEDFLVEELPKELPACKEGDYVHFTLEKRNWETIAAVKSIAKSLGVSSNRFGYAGNKDKRAVTRQRVAVRGGQARQTQGSQNRRNSTFGSRCIRFSIAPRRLARKPIPNSCEKSRPDNSQI